MWMASWTLTLQWTLADLRQYSEKNHIFDLGVGRLEALLDMDHF